MADTKKWMSALPDQTNITKINIPGTHDSASRFVLASWITKCQHTDIPRQLNMGVRLLDIRMELKENTFVLVHAIIDCRKKRFIFSEKLTFGDVFTVCRDFLKENPSETILVSIKEDDGHNGDVFYEKFYNQFVANNKAAWFLENRFPTLGECRGKLVLLRRCGLGNMQTDDEHGIDLSHWPDQGSRESCEPKISDLHNGADKVIIQDRYSFFMKEKWFNCIVPALQNAQPDGHTAFLHATSTAGGLLPFASSGYINRKLVPYLNEDKKVHGWFMVDFITPKICETIIKQNN